MRMIGDVLARRRLSKGTRRIAAAWMARPFARGTGRRVVAFHDPNRISYSQLYPFFHYGRELHARFGVTLRAYPFQDLLTGKRAVVPQADDILLQPWFTVPPKTLAEVCARLRQANPDARISFLDSYAHNDLRLAAHLPEDLSFYVKKSLYKDFEHYRTCYRDTYLSGHYAEFYDVDGPFKDFRAPESVLEKLRLSPNFFTAPHLIGGFLAPAPPPQDGRTLDVQARLAVTGSPWYQAMRQQARSLVAGLEGVSVSGTDLLSLPQFNAELRRARLCFSPFGYGELCWRDIEAIQAGAVLIKQDMSHLRTLPDLYEPGVTYLPVKWDFSDLEEVVRTALADDDLRMRLSQEAFRRVSAYVSTARFVEDVGFLFA